MGKQKRHQPSSLPSSSNYSFIHVGSSPTKSQSKIKKKISGAQRKSFYRMFRMKDALKRSTKIPSYKIPESKLQRALDMLNDDSLFPKSKLWQLSCQPSIHEIDRRKREIVKSQSGKLLKEARKCLLKRDWSNLAKILCITKTLDNNSYYVYFDVFKKYAEICLMHNPDKQLLDNFKNGILSSKDNDADDVLFRKITRKFDNDYNGENSDDNEDERDAIGAGGENGEQNVVDDNDAEDEDDNDVKVENDDD